MKRMQTLNAFWNSFGILAYDEGSVPEDAKLPYITYSAGQDFFGSSVSLYADIWYKGYSWEDIENKLEQVTNRITSGGITVPYDGGGMIIRPGRPYASRVRDELDYIRRIRVNVEIEFVN